MTTSDLLPGAPSFRRPVLDSMYRHARACFPDECCGFVVGDGADAQVVCGANVRKNRRHDAPGPSPRATEHAYLLDDSALLEFAYTFLSDRPPTVIFHSHPIVGAYFSLEDRRAALHSGWEIDYLVIDVQSAIIPEARLYRRRRNTDCFVEIAHYPGRDW